jgi:two-component system, LytTR family, response regulator LytT
MHSVKIGIVEDEVIIAEGISSTLKQLGYAVAEPACNYTEALTMIAEEKPDLMLLDITLSGSKDGIDLAWKIKELYNIPFIFLTANADVATVERAKKTEPPAYLVKPFNKDELYASIEICLHNFSQQQSREQTEADGNYVIQDSIFIKEGNYFHKVKISDILYLESEHVYVNVHTINRKILVRAPLQQYLSNFSDKLFFRVHRSYAVNLQHVDTINTEYVIIKGQEIPISKSFRSELLSRLKLG